jgi:hypothetical protein
MPKLTINPSALLSFRDSGYPTSFEIGRAIFSEHAETVMEKIEAELGKPIELDLTEDEAICLAVSIWGNPEIAELPPQRWPRLALMDALRGMQ